MKDNSVNNFLRCYPVFRFLFSIPLLRKKSIPVKSFLITAIMLSLIVMASLIDRTLVLKGNNVGLFQHPLIWTFLIIQVALPFSIISAIRKFLCFLDENEIINSKIDLSSYKSDLNNLALRKTNLSKFAYYILITIGFLSFIWNSYQNQLPIKFLGFDFWDSMLHPYGYWITRVYKFYIWVFLFPSCAHIQIVILIVLNKLLKNSIEESTFLLKPYHHDGYGGASEIIRIAIHPFIPILICASISVLSVFIIHQGMSVTSLTGLIILSGIFLGIYLVPAIILHRAIKTEKQRQLKEISEKQDLIFLALPELKSNNLLSQEIESLSALDSISKQIKSISNWPELRLILKLVGFVNIPTLIGLVKTILPLLLKILKS